jgi:hypothetical protein
MEASPNPSDFERDLMFGENQATRAGVGPEAESEAGQAKVELESR